MIGIHIKDVTPADDARVRLSFRVIRIDSLVARVSDNANCIFTIPLRCSRNPACSRGKSPRLDATLVSSEFISPKYGRRDAPARAPWETRVIEDYLWLRGRGNFCAAFAMMRTEISCPVVSCKSRLLSTTLSPTRCPFIIPIADAITMILLDKIKIIFIA